MPVLLIAGQHDAKYRQLARDMRQRIPAAQINIVEGAGHAVHLERPGAFAPLVKEFLTTCLQQNQQPAPSAQR
jgi:2-succinyl-6-hydroxy-2,4-cyclohexadiene-1-carboxylate synthase